MVAFNVIALALALCGPALAHGHHGHHPDHHPNGTGGYHPGHPTKLPGHLTRLSIHPSHLNGGDFGRTTLTSRYRSPTALPSGPRTSVVDDAAFPAQTNTFEETTTRVPGAIYPTGAGGLCSNCTYGNATKYTFAARSAHPVEVIHEERQDEPSHVAQEKQEEQEEQANFKHHVGLPKIIPTEIPIFNHTEGFHHKIPQGFAHISTFLKRGRDAARATDAPAAEGN